MTWTAYKAQSLTGLSTIFLIPGQICLRLMHPHMNCWTGSGGGASGRGGSGTGGGGLAALF